MLNKKYESVFIIDNLDDWKNLEQTANYSLDLILTFDFSVFHYINKKSGHVKFVDKLVSPEKMHENNHLLYQFIRRWHFDVSGIDFFQYKGISFGYSFKMDIWNDLVYYTRLFLCLSTLEDLDYQTLFVSSRDKYLLKALDSLCLDYNKCACSEKQDDERFLFPISKYIDDRIRAEGIRRLLYFLREYGSSIISRVSCYIDKYTKRNERKTVFIQEYHPTKKILNYIRDNKKINVLLVNFSRGGKMRNALFERVIPIYGAKSKFNNIAIEMIERFFKDRSSTLVLSNGHNITSTLYEIIESRVNNGINEKLRVLECCIHYLDKNKIELEILIANIGLVSTLFDCVCKSKGIPSYLIINGWLGPSYDDEAKYATTINAYSSGIKNTYFEGMDNIVTLGDPRMDMYPPDITKKQINRNNPTVVIGASGFNSIDLNSYVAVEFDFMFDVLTALKCLIEEGCTLKVIIKVRPNGYIRQYKNFILQYFPNLPIELSDNVSMISVLQKADYYISIYSQTLFEASCLGIPVVYYKKDIEVMFSPFDNRSELVTATSVEDLIEAFQDFQAYSSRYEPFLDRNIMEKYIGPLDGGNFQRNLSFIEKLLSDKLV